MKLVLKQQCILSTQQQKGGRQLSLPIGREVQRGGMCGGDET